MSFYVTLPSNASMNYHPNNVQSNFNVTLPHRLNLDNNFQVGLAEISYNQSIDVDIGVIHIEADIKNLYERTTNEHYIKKLLKNDFKFIIGIPIPCQDCIKLTDLFETINSQINKELIKYFDKLIRVEKLVTHENNNWQTVEEYFDEFIKKIQPNFSYLIDNNKCILKIQPYVSIKFERQLIEILNEEEIKESDKENNVILDILGNQLIHVCDSYNIWVNIIQEQLYGDVKAKIIRNVIPDGIHGQHITLIYNTIHYVDLLETSFQTINIMIKDNSDQLIHFTNKLSKVVVKLHFKSKNERI